MPEYMGKKITRAQELSRHAYRRALTKAVREIAKGTDWRSIEGCLFCESKGWFISITPAVYVFDQITLARVTAKPMSVDPVFWDLVGLPENLSKPLSFRFNGAWTCRPPPLVEMEVPEDPDPNVVAARILSIADSQRISVLAQLSMDAFIMLCRDRGQENDTYLPSLVSALIATGREGEAMAACKRAQAIGQIGGFLAPQGTFVEMALNWLSTRPDETTLH